MTIRLPSAIVLVVSNMLGVYLCLFAGDPVFIWLSLELLSLSYAGVLCCCDGDSVTAESLAKYFIPNSISNLIYLFCSILHSAVGYWGYASLGTAILFIKLGLPPLHFWVPGAVGGLHAWVPVLFLLGPHKLAPLHVLAQSGSISSEFLILGVGGAWFGAVGCYVQVGLKRVLAFSSTSSIGWLVVAAAIDDFVVYVAWVMYVIPISVFLLCINNNPFVVIGRNPAGFALMATVVGWPGGGGFSINWAVLFVMISKGYVWLAFALSCSAVFTVGAFLKIIISSQLTPTASVTYNVNPPVWLLAYVGIFYFIVPCLGIFL